MFTKNRLFSIVLIVAAAAVANMARAEVLYYDDFSGSTSSYLNGTTPDTTQGTATWSSAADRFTAAGTYAGGSYSTEGAFLPLAVEAGYIYTITAQATVTTVVSNKKDNFCIAFSRNFYAVSGSNISKHFATSLCAFPGSGATHSAGYSGSATDPTVVVASVGNVAVNTSTSTIALVLDTTGDAWSTTSYLNGVELGTYTYTTNPSGGDNGADNIVRVGFSNYQSTVDVSYFKVERTAGVVPEPSTTVLMFTAIGGLLCCAWRKRK